MHLKLQEMKNTIYNLLPQIGLALFLLIGILVYRDYGLAWDEWAQMTERGEVNYNFVTTLDSATLLKSPGIYQGPAFDLSLVALQRFLNITDSREVYFFRHLVTFIFFWFSGLAFYLLLRRKYTDRFIIFIGICWYFLMPRIFADSFYNTKDVPFLVMAMVCLLSLTAFLEKPTWKRGLLHGLFCGFMIDIRLMGAFMPVVTLFMFFSKVLFAEGKTKTAISYFIPVGTFILSMIVFTILFWPVLWLDPLHHFIKGWKEMSNFTFATTTLFEGKYIYNNQLPWYYDSLWMLITIPLQYICFFFLGICFIIIKPSSFKKDRFFELESEIASLLVFFIPLITIILFHSTEYDGWRHVFFLFAPLCIIAVRGLYETRTWLVKYAKQSWINLSVLALTLPVAYGMVKMHPYQNMYFNRIVGPDVQSAKFKYEMDYWGLAFREAMEKLYFQSTDARISVYALSPTGVLTVGILPENMRSRFIFTSFENANYSIHDYRWDSQEYNNRNRIDSVKVDGAVISSTYHLREAHIQVVRLKTRDGKYLYVSKLPDRRVTVSDKEMETFSIFSLAEGKCCIYTSENKFATAELDKQSEITASRDALGSWEVFSIIQIDINHIALKAGSNKYVSLDPKSLQLFANGDSIGENEKFEMEILNTKK
jgi:hypothetical protein